MQLVIDKRCFKIDRINAYAMINGYSKGGRNNRQSIWCAVADRPFPMLITLNRTPTPFPINPLYRYRNLEEFSIPYKYVVNLDSEYFIRNDIELWKKLCGNSLFDIWDPTAPYIRFEQSRSNPRKFRIQLLRIYEIEEEFDDTDVIPVSSRVDHLINPNRTVTIKKPVIEDDDFLTIKSLLRKSVYDFRW